MEAGRNKIGHAYSKFKDRKPNWFIGNPINQPLSAGEGKRPYFAEWHDLRNEHNYAYVLYAEWFKEI